MVIKDSLTRIKDSIIIEISDFVNNFKFLVFIT